jgi:heat shock protein HslJ
VRLLLLAAIAISAYAAEPPLATTHWTLVTVAGKPALSGPGIREAFLTFDSKTSRVGGNSGCNGTGGSFATKGNELKFDQMISTQMACAKTMEQERAFFKALENTRTYKVSEQLLDLLDSSGKVLARFEAKNRTER